MGPPYKRRRITRNDNPDADFHERRARNDLRLKSVFESIFEKYGKDFSGIADEINLQTGEIIVNRGHVHGMRDETDPGCEKDLYDELNSDDETEDLARQGKADINLRKELYGGHRDPISRSGPWPAEYGVSNLSWKSRLQPRPSAVTSSHQRPIDLSFNDGQAIEPVWRAPPLPKQIASVQEVASVPLFNPHQREHERSVSLPDLSLWAPEISKSHSEMPRGRQNKNLSTRRPKSPTEVQNPAVEKNLPAAKVSSLNYEWSRISVRSRIEQTIEGSVPSTLPASSVEPEPTETAAWTLREDQLLRYLKSARTPYSRIVVYYPGRTEADLEDRWFELHGLNSKLLSLEDDESRTLDQRLATSRNKDRQTLHSSSPPTIESDVPDDKFSSAHLRHMPVPRRNSTSHEAKAPQNFHSVNIPKSQTRSNENWRLQTNNKETPRTAKSIPVPTSISPPDDLSDDELSVMVQTVGTTVTGPTKVITSSSHAPRRRTFHI